MANFDQFLEVKYVVENKGLSISNGTVVGKASIQDESSYPIQKQGFRIGNLCLLSDIETTSELTSMPQVCKVPNAIPWLLGFTNLHGNILPVFDIALLLDQTHSSDNKQMLLVFGNGDAAAGVVIDGYPVTHSLFAGNKVSIKKAPMAIAKYSNGGYVIENNMWLDFDCLKFIADHSELMANNA
jgi:chemotaxis signal transduction protein